MTEAELIERVRAGARESFGPLYDRHKNWVYRYVCRYLGPGETSADLVQEIFLRALESLPRFDPSQNFGAWLNGIAHHTLTDALRRRYRQPKESNVMLEEHLTEPKLTYPPPDAEVLDAQTVSQILTNLSEEQQQLIRWRLLDGFSSGEVARRLYGVDDPDTRRKVTVGLYRAMQAARRVAESQENIR